MISPGNVAQHLRVSLKSIKQKNSLPKGVKKICSFFRPFSPDLDKIWHMRYICINAE